jgi:hypothetical protein
MSITTRRVVPILLALLVPAAALAQALPTTQPKYMRVIREDVKLGRNADHAKFEAGWPAAYEAAKSPDFYIAMESMTNNEAWYISPFASYAAMGEMLSREQQPALQTELTRLQRGDAEFINSFRAVELRARPDLSFGAYPDIAKQRYWEISIYRMRPGGEQAFAEAAKSYGAASTRTGSKSGYRVYEVIAGMPQPTFFVFSTVSNFAEFDGMFSAGDAVMKAMGADDEAVWKKFSDASVNYETMRFRLSPEMSYVPKETRATDPAFWGPKKP